MSLRSVPACSTPPLPSPPTHPHVPAYRSRAPGPLLAGSERISKSEVAGQQLKEAQAINKSLSALGDVIQSLQSKSGHVPYRNSKLTQVRGEAYWYHPVLWGITRLR